MRGERGVTLMELLVVITLMALLATGILMAMRVGMGALDRSSDRLMANRRVVGVDRIIEAQVAGLVPATIQCAGRGDAPGPTASFFEGDPETMRFATSYSLHYANRGAPLMLAYQVIPRDDGSGVRLVVNEQPFPTERSGQTSCTGVAPEPVGGAMLPRFGPVEIGPASFVLADKLAYCRFSYRATLTKDGQPAWMPHWPMALLPTAIRVEMAPLEPDPAHLNLLTLTMPLHVTRDPMMNYAE